MNYKTTEAHFATFIKYTRKTLDFLGLKAWCVHFVHPELETPKNVAEISYNLDNRFVAIGFNTVIVYRPTNDFIKRYAIHECVHLLLAPISRTVTSNGTIDCDSQHEHAIVRTLENILVEIVR